MNYPPKGSVGGSYAVKGSDQRVVQHEKVFNSASEALDAYIKAYEKQTNLYTRRPSDLLAPKPKFYFMDSLERSMFHGKSPGQKVDDLVAWVNQTYNDNVKSTVQPFGGRTLNDSRQFEASDLTRSSHSSSFSSPMRRTDIDELSSLPSASSSLVDLESNPGTVETEVLLSSYKGEKPEDKYSRSNIYSPPKFRSPAALKSPSHSPQKSRNNFEYPSWVSHLGKEYPSWVEDLDNTALSKRSSRSPQQNATKSYSDSNLYNNTGRVTTRGTNNLRLSELQHSQSKSRTAKSHLGGPGKEWNDTASMDTDILLTQPIYGQNPINMGGDLHKSFYQDHKVNRIKKESSKKLKKSDKSQSRARESSYDNARKVSTKSKSLMFTPEHVAQPPSPRGYHTVPAKSRSDLARDSSPGRYKDYSPLRSGDHSRSPERLEVRPTQFSMPVRTPNFDQSEDHSRSEQSPYKIRKANKSYPEPKKLSTRGHEVGHSRQKKSLSSSKSKHSVTKLTSKDLGNGDDTDTDREMRKSPTGIKMEKMYREPTSMYPWKTMIQSQKSVAFSEENVYSPGKPIYESTPMVRKDYSEERKYKTIPKDFKREHETPYFNKRTEPKQASIFTSTQKEHSVNHKPPVFPKTTQRKGRHKRSQTMPDLRKIATQSHSRSGRSYDDDMLSIVTSDTEILITQPPMPIVDVSPSLTTVSDSSDTVVGSDSELEPEHVNSHHVNNSNKSITMDSRPEEVQGDKFSPTSVFASSSPFAAVREELPKRYHLWKLDDDTTAPDSFIRKRHLQDKTNIISSFLEDCLNIDEDSYDENKNKIRSPSYHSSTYLDGRESATGPKEALKNMLFTMQDMAHHDDETPRSTDNRRVHFKQNRAPADDADSVNDDKSDSSSQLFHGEESLQRAYHHLQRLKRLVGSEDDQSSVTSY